MEEEENYPEYGNFVEGCGEQVYIPIIPMPPPYDPEISTQILKSMGNKSGTLGSDKLVKKATTLSTGLHAEIPSLWGPLMERSLRHHPASRIDFEQYTPIYPKRPSLKKRLTSFLARWLHDLSEKFEECGFRDY